MKKIFAYAHTHWDREWYQPFETFRTQFVSVLRQILDDIEAGKLSRFYLDGQAIILEDALEVAPELAPRIKALMDKGELAAGPWYVLPDEMLVTGESLVRNLQMGINSVRKFGRPQLVGYSPDTFGHSQDLPRILQGFAINSAFVWRGVPPLSYGPCFWWQSPDGTKVLAYHLSRGYYQTSLIEKTIAEKENGSLDKIAEDLKIFAEDRSQWDNSSLHNKTPDAFLYPIGADHTAPPRDLNDSINKLNKKLAPKGWQITPIHLHEFAELLEQQASASHTLVGLLARELRDNCASAQYANAYLLPGVLSARLYLKRANREAERRLFRFAEPLFSLLTVRKALDYPAAELNRALKLLLENHPHDSICGCSVDAVHDEMMVRYARFNQIIDALLDDAKRKLALLPDQSCKSADDPEAGLHQLRAINPSARLFTGAVPIQWYAAGAAEEHYGENVQLISSEKKEQLFAGWGRVPYYSSVEARSAYIWLEDIPAYGERNLAWPLSEKSKSVLPAVKQRGKTLDNGILKVSVDDRSHLNIIWHLADGNEKHYQLSHSFKDTADGGDTYNYDPIPGDKPIFSKLLSVTAGQKGPLVCSLILKYEIKIPEILIEEKREMGSGNGSGLPIVRRSTQRLVHEIETELILKRGSRILEFETRWKNQATGHRLEVLLSTGLPVHTSFSENHFSLVRRYHQTKNAHKISLPVERGSEAPCDRFPSQRFVISNGQLFLNKGLPEYGAEGESISLTILRSVSWLSRGRIQSRGGGAGPHLSVPGAECKGLNKASYAWSPLPVFQKAKILADVIDEEALLDAYDLAEAYEQEILCAFSTSNDSNSDSLFKCDNPAIKILGSYMSADSQALFLRLQNLTPNTLGTRVFLDFNFQSAHLCRLDEEVGEEVFLYREYVQTASDDGGKKEVCALEVNFGASELKTIKFHLQDQLAEKPSPASKSRKKGRTSAKTG